MPTTNISQRTALAAAISACFPATALGAGVARVDFAIGNVTAVAPDGRSRALSKGSEIDVGETVSTQQGRAQLRFSDGAYMSLQPQTEFKVDEFKFSGKPQDQNDSIVMSLLKGGMRTITGLIGRANRNNYQLRTDVATIGIRGTEYSVKYTNSIEVFCADGSIFLQNEGGILQLNGGQGGYVASNDTPPQQTENRPNLPPESPVQQELLEQQNQVSDPVNPIQESQQTTLLTGTHIGNWAVVNPSIFGNDASQTITLDASGVLLSFADNVEGGTTTIGSSTGISDGNDGVIAWGRWANGTTGGDSFFGSGNDTTSPSELHYVVGIAPTAIPTSGEATYSMIGATPPSVSEGSVTLNTSMLTVNFGTSTGSFHANFTVNGSTADTGRSGAGFSVLSGGALTGSGSLFGGCCFSGSISLTGVLAGQAAARAGMAYSLSAFDGSSSAGAHGAIAYQKD